MIELSSALSELKGIVSLDGFLDIVDFEGSALDQLSKQSERIISRCGLPPPVVEALRSLSEAALKGVNSISLKELLEKAETIVQDALTQAATAEKEA